MNPDPREWRPSDDEPTHRGWCDHCGHVLYDRKPPKYCSACGAQLNLLGSCSMCWDEEDWH